MGKVHRHGVESSAAIMHHPIHPMLIAFPVTTLIGAALTDAVFLVTGGPFWSTASWWLLLSGIVSGAVAAVPGAIDYFTIPKVRSLPSAKVHGLGNLLAITLAIINLLMRDSDGSVVTSLEFILSLAVVGLLGVTAWLGGELSYRHRIGVIANDSDSITDKVARN